MKSFICVKLQMEGLHCFPQADELFPDVHFLSSLHRHIFHFKLEKEVFHDDRDIEFILFKRTVQEFLIKKYYSSEYNCLHFSNMSCEMIAKELLLEFNCVSVEVWEDNENGAKIIR
jgi:hypothetical protein